MAKIMCRVRLSRERVPNRAAQCRSMNTAILISSVARACLRPTAMGWLEGCALRDLVVPHGFDLPQPSRSRLTVRVGSSRGQLRGWIHVHRMAGIGAQRKRRSGCHASGHAPEADILINLGAAS